MSESGDAADRDALMREAAGWFARMRGPDAEAHRSAFDAWLAGAPGHRAAYNRAAEIFAMGKLLADDAAAASPTRRRAAVPVLATLAAIALVAATYLLVVDKGPRSTMTTAPDQALTFRHDGTNPRRERLADGSEVSLAPGTAIAIAFDSAQRIITLDRGRARFAVAHEERPFIVRAGGGSVTARGTLFEVDRASGRVTVRLIEGAVDVRTPPAGGGEEPVRRLRPGQTIAFAAREARAALPAGRDAARAVGQARTAEGTREYQAVRLADLLAEAGRGGARPIRLADPALGELRVSGRFGIADTERLADRLARLFDLRLDRSDPAALVLHPR